MKTITLFILITVFSLPVYSQAYEGTIEYDKKKQAAFVIEYAFPPEAVEDALINKMEELGYKGKEERGLFNKDKGFRVHKAAHIVDIHNDRFDYVFKVESKSRKNKDESVIYMIILKDGENAKPTFDAADIRRAKAFLTNLQPMVESADLEIKIRTQEATVVKSEKKLKDLREDQESMEKKVKELQEDLKTNARNQEEQKKLIESQKLALDDLKGKRRA